VYELLALAEPQHGAPLTGYPMPEQERIVPSAYAVYTRQYAGGVDVRRVPASVDTAATAPAGWWRHLAVDEHEWDLRLLHSAALLVVQEPYKQKRAHELLARLPGADMTVAPVEDGVMVTMRGGGQVEVGDPGRRWDPMLLGAVVRTVLRADAPVAALTVRAGGVVSPVYLRRRE
jgi:hypothetical protein